MEATECVRELVELGQRQPLRNAEDLERAKYLMKELRRMGYTNQEIQKLTKNVWSESTIKLYTRGTVVDDGRPKANAIELLSEMAANDITLDDVKRVIELKSKLIGASIEGAVSMVNEAIDLGTNLTHLAAHLRINSEMGVHPKQVLEVLNYKLELKKLGFDIDSLKTLTDLAKKHGDPDNLVKAVNAYADLVAINSELQEKRELRDQLKAVETRLATVRAELEFLESLRNLGFSNDQLVALGKLARDWGGVPKVMDGMKLYSSVKEIEAAIDNLKRTNKDLESEFNKLNTDNAHLQTLIGLCHRLLFELKFSMKTIEDVYELAKMAGEPTEVLKALGRYRELVQIEEDINAMEQKKHGLEDTLKELESLEERHRLYLQYLDKTALEETQRFAAAIMSHHTASAKEMEKLVQEHAKNLAKAEALADELKLAQVFNAIYKYPENVKDLSEEHAIMMIEAGCRFLYEKGVDAKLSFPPSFTKKHPVFVNFEGTPVIDILTMILLVLRPSVVLDRK